MVTSYGSAMKKYFLVKYLQNKRLITHQQSNKEFKTPIVQRQNEDSEILFYIFFLFGGGEKISIYCPEGSTT